MIKDIKSSFKKGSIITKLIYVNVGAFLLMWIVSIFAEQADNWLTLPGSFTELIYKPWTILTYMFLHGGFLHLLMNMLWLFWLGIIFLRYMNGKQLLAVYLIGGFAGALLHLCINILLSTKIGIVGASAAVMAIVFAAASYKPNYIIHLFFIGPVKIKYLALIAFVLDLMGVVSNLKGEMGLGDGIAHFAHFGGAFYGLWFGYEMRKGKDITRRFNNFLNNLVSFFTSTKKKEKVKITRNKFEKPKSKREYKKSQGDKNDQINEILDKISKSGYDSLTKKEKEFLFKQKENKK